MKLAIKLTSFSEGMWTTPREAIEALCDAAKKLNFPVSIKFRERKIIAHPESCRATLLQSYRDSEEGETVE